MTGRGRGCVKTETACHVGSIAHDSSQQSRVKLNLRARKCTAPLVAQEFLHIHGRPSLPSTQSHNGKKVKNAAIHPDFGAAMPLSLMEYAGRFLINLTSFSLPV
jgi:hypothetical protein